MVIEMHIGYWIDVCAVAEENDITGESQANGVAYSESDEQDDLECEFIICIFWQQDFVCLYLYNISGCQT
jgi:hypothetical protein